MIGPVRTALRSLTRPMHDQVEARTWSKRLVAKTLTPRELLQGLAHWLAFLEVVEDRAHSQAGWLWRPELDRAPALRSDLGDVRVPLPAALNAGLVALPAPQLPGLLYVVAGSALGGRGLAAPAQAVLGREVAFYAEPGPLRGFGPFMERMEARAEALPSWVKGAQIGFELVDQLLAELEPKSA